MYNIYSFKKKSPRYLVDGFEVLQFDTGLHQSSGITDWVECDGQRGPPILLVWDFSRWYVENKCNRFLNATSGVSGEAGQYIPHWRCWVVFVVTCGVTVSPCLTTAHLCPYT